MKRIHIFKTGTHRDSKGTTLDFNDETLSAAAASYLPTTSEAPIVVGHPKGNAPAFGWIQSLEFDEETGNLYAVPHNVNADFEEVVENGAYKKVSASWYLPDHPNNPHPGQLYLRHVGFLGAQPPAIKGLEGIEFSEEDGTAEFDEWDSAFVAKAFGRIARSWREFVIDKFGKEEADKVIPTYEVEDIERTAQSMIDHHYKTDEPLTPDYSEEQGMDLDQAKARIAALEGENADLTTQRDQLTSQVTEFNEAEQQRQKDALAGRVDQLVTDGKLLPAQRNEVLAFCEQLDNTQTVEFGEGDDKQTGTMADRYLSQFGKQVVEFNEQSQEDGAPEVPATASALTAKAVEYKEEQAKQGRSIDIVTAVNELNAQASE